LLLVVGARAQTSFVFVDSDSDLNGNEARSNKIIGGQ
jgi:hypothetical protein